MRFDLLLDPVYSLATLWGAFAGPQVCPSTASIRPQITDAAVASPAPAMRADVIAFVGVNVIPMDQEQVLSNQTVVVTGRRITALGPAATVKVPAGAMRVDGRGRYLMPGLADMHAHFWGDDRQIKEETPTYATDGSYDWYYGGATENTEQRAYRLFSYVANGVTTIRNINNNASPKEIEIQEQIWQRFRTGDAVRPHIYISGAVISEALIRGLKPDSVAAFVAAYKAAGKDFFNVSPRLVRARDTIPAMDSLLVAARRLGVPVATHAHTRSFGETLALGTANGSYEHLYSYWDTLGIKTSQKPATSAELGALAAATRRAGTWITPTLNCLELNGSNPFGPNNTLTWQLVKTLQDSGVGLLLGADSDSRWKMSPSLVHVELTALVEHAKLTPYQALATGTRNVARYFGTLDSTGTIAVGKRADLVLLYGNPLVDIRHTREPAGVMVAGRWLDRAMLDQQLLAAPKTWFWVEMEGGFDPHLTNEQLKTIAGHIKIFRALSDSLALAPASTHQRLRQQLTAELGAIRATLTPDQQVAFDPKVRVWLREQARLGVSVTIPGVKPVP